MKDMAAYKAGLDSHKWADKVDKDLNQGKAAGVQGTPAFFVNGVFINGAQPFDNFKKTIDQELAKAQAKIAVGHAQEPRLPRDDQGEQDERARRRGQEARGEQGRHDDGLQGPRRQQPGARQPERAGHHHRVLRLPVPLLLARRADPQGHPRQVRRQGAPRLEERAATLSHPRRAGRRSGDGAARREGRQGLLGHARHPVREPEGPGGRRIWPSTPTQAGGSADKVKDAIANHTHKKEIDADNDLSQDFQASGTPHFFVNGRRLVGAQPEEKFDADHRRGDHQGPGLDLRRARSPATCTTRSPRTARAPLRPR